MYSSITVLSGVVLALMVAVNGELSTQFGVWGSSFIVQAIGTVFAFMAILVKRDKMISKANISKWYYLTGVITASITVFQNAAFRYISMTSIIALGLVGQTIISLVIDQFGWFGMKKTAPSKSVLISLIFAVVGICVMADGTISASLWAMILSLAAGVTIVLSRIFNAKIAECTSVLQGSFISYFLGLPVVAAVAWVTGEISFDLGITAANSWMYIGGVLGVLVVLMCNLTVPHVSVFKLTMFIFLGQVFTGIALDILFRQFAMDASFWGGIIILIGILISKITDR